MSSKFRPAVTTLIAVALSLCGYGSDANSADEDAFIRKVESATPWMLWTSLGDEEFQAKAREFEAIGSEFQSFPVATARRIVEELTKRSLKREATPGEPLDSLSRIYVLNRFYFNVPSTEQSSKARYFGGWVGVPYTKENVDLLWPVSVRNGALRITGTCKGYAGETYDPLWEFKFFNDQYGPRRDGSPRMKILILEKSK